jgi:pantoate--beta-alanine ligase
VIVSIFVNPKQFGPQEDFSKYPRQEAADLQALAGVADLVFAPAVGEMYPDGFATAVSVTGSLTEELEGATRPGHFLGMATVVAKLLVQCLPDFAMFGEKDWQQLQIVRRMARDLDLPLEIVGHATVRDEHGLALSSRNAYLSGDELAVARQLNRVLAEVREHIATDGPDTSLAQGRDRLTALGFAVDYLALTDAATLERVDTASRHRPGRLLVAARLGAVRLIDNIAVP